MCQQNAGKAREERLKVATLTIRSLEAEVVDALKARARRNQRSLEAEVRVLLRDLVTSGSASSLRELADQIAALTPKVRQTDGTEMIREDRMR
jgi:plasmid stability protein